MILRHQVGNTKILDLLSKWRDSMTHQGETW